MGCLHNIADSKILKQIWIGVLYRCHESRNSEKRFKQQTAQKLRAGTSPTLFKISRIFESSLGDP